MKQKSRRVHQIDLTAAGWLVRLDRGLGAAEQDEFLQWLASDPRHGEWLARHRHTWTDLDGLSQWRPEHTAEPNPDLLLRSAPRSNIWRATLVGAAASLLLAFLVWRTPTPPVVAPHPESNPPQATGYESRVLDDGSIVELNRGAHIRLEYTPAERGVRLIAGEAHFKIVRDSRRPFVVRAKTVAVRAIGTAFDVKLDSDSIEVLVTEGRVQVSPPAASSGVGAAELAAGEQMIVSLAQPAQPLEIARLTPAEITRRLGWQPKLFDFNSTPLEQVVSAFNRRNEIQLVIADEALAAVPIVASFRSDNVDGFVRLLELTAGVEAVRSERTITLRRAR